jgi:hypothetical protein
LLIDRYSTCGEDEDVVSMALTAVHRLLRHSGIQPSEVGMLNVGCPVLDRSKSMKTELMTLLETKGCSLADGVDYCDAYTGAASSIRDCIIWSQSGSWDGRLAVAVCSDSLTSAAPTAVLVSRGSRLWTHRKLMLENARECAITQSVVDRLLFASTSVGRAEMAASGEISGADWVSFALRTDRPIPILDAAAFEAVRARCADTLGRFGWNARPSIEQSSDAYYLQETPPKADGAAARRYLHNKFFCIEYIPQRPAAAMTSVPASPAFMESTDMNAVTQPRSLVEVPTAARCFGGQEATLLAQLLGGVQTGSDAPP